MFGVTGDVFRQLERSQYKKLAMAFISLQTNRVATCTEAERCYTTTGLLTFCDLKDTYHIQKHYHKSRLHLFTSTQ